MTANKTKRADRKVAYLDLKDRFGVGTPYGRMWAASLDELERKYEFVFGRRLIVLFYEMVR